MRTSHLILFFMLAPLLPMAQHLGYNQYELLSREQLKAAPGSLDNQYDDIKGTAFFSPQWLSAVAITARGVQYTGLKVRFDLYKNVFFANVHDTIYDLSAAGIVRFILYPLPADTSVSYVFQKGFSTGTIRPEQYIQVLVMGKLTFLKQPTLEVKEVNEDSFLAKVKKFVNQDYYYLVARDGQGEIVRLNKKTLEKEMADKWDAVTRYAKEKELSFNEEQGWIYIVKYYDSINKL